MLPDISGCPRGRAFPGQSRQSASRKTSQLLATSSTASRIPSCALQHKIGTSRLDHKGSGSAYIATTSLVCHLRRRGCVRHLLLQHIQSSIAHRSVRGSTRSSDAEPLLTTFCATGSQRIHFLYEVCPGDTSGITSFRQRDACYVHRGAATRCALSVDSGIERCVWEIIYFVLSPLAEFYAPLRLDS